MPYDIPKEKGGDSVVNVQKLEACMKKVGMQNSHLDTEDLRRICMDQTFGSAETGQKVGGS